MILLDSLLALGVVALALGALTASRAFTATWLFIAFGLVVALAWFRLGAPSVALAEAVIGAGITGALLMEAVAITRMVQRRGG